MILGIQFELSISIKIGNKLTSNLCILESDRFIQRKFIGKKISNPSF